jgi:hypothetical protein
MSAHHLTSVPQELKKYYNSIVQYVQVFFIFIFGTASATRIWRHYDDQSCGMWWMAGPGVLTHAHYSKT